MEKCKVTSSNDMKSKETLSNDMNSATRISRLASMDERCKVRNILREDTEDNGDETEAARVCERHMSSLMNQESVSGAETRPERIVINFFPMKLPEDVNERGAFLKKKWLFDTDKPARSQVMKTTLQSTTRAEELELRKIRKLLGIPQDNNQYSFLFMYPSKSKAFLGGYVYFNGPWRGLTKDTTIVGANMLIYSSTYTSDSLYSMNLVRVKCGLLHDDGGSNDGGKTSPTAASSGMKKFEDHVEEALMVEAKKSSGLLPDHKHFVGWRRWATHMSWIPPHHAQGLTQDINDSVLAGQSGSFLFIDEREKKSLDKKYSLYSMVIRKMLGDPPHKSLREMPQKQANRIANRYLKGKQSQPDDATPRLIVLLGGSGAGKSSVLRRLSKATGGKVDPENSNWILSGLDEFISFVPEYEHAIQDISVGYANAATYAYRNAIQIATAVNLQCIRRRINMIFEDTGKNLHRTAGVIKEFGRDRIVSVVLVDNSPDVAIERAAGRFQVTGRYSPSDYIRSSFMNVFEHYLELKRMCDSDELSVDHFIYNDNHSSDSPMWLDGGKMRHLIAPEKSFSSGPVQYRPHYSVLWKMVQHIPSIRDEYNKFVRKLASAGGEKKSEDETSGACE